MPYGYYQFVRFAALVGFAILAYQGYETIQLFRNAIIVELGSQQEAAHAYARYQKCSEYTARNLLVTGW